MVVTPGLPEQIQTVSQFNRRVARTLQDQFGVQQVRGEISMLTRAASGHWYFTLKDASAQVRCVMFRGRNSLVNFSPREGDEVVVTALVNLYEPRGDFQLTVESMRRQGAGQLWEQFLQLRKRLGDEGLFDTDLKRPLPALPRRIGIITSVQAAALRDVIATLRRRAPYAGVIVYPVPVQGAEAGAAIAAMLDTANQRNEVDVLLLVRGGGSIEDLWAFNEEVVARALRRGHLPVICGVGHESDVTIADFAADRRAPTPTAAAEMVAPDWREQAGAVSSLTRRLRRSAAQGFERRVQRLDHARRLLASPRNALGGLRWRLASQTRALQRALSLRVRRQQDHVQQSLRTLSHLNVQNVLDRGFAILQDANGALVKEANTRTPGEVLNAQLAQGHLLLQVVETEPLRDPHST